MRNSICAACLLLTSIQVQAAAENYALDADHTTVAFLVDHLGFAKTLGRFADVEGSFLYDEETRELSDVQIVIKTASVQSDHKARDKHLRGKDFLSVKKHPTMTFSASSLSSTGDNTGTIEGELTLLGQTHPLTLDVMLNKSDKYPFGHKKQTLGVSARGSVQRSLYGMDYAVANKLVGDQVDLIIEIEAIQQ